MTVYLTSDSDLTSVANAIRTKGGTSSSLTYPTGFVTAINNISGSTWQDVTSEFIDADANWDSCNITALANGSMVCLFGSDQVSSWLDVPSAYKGVGIITIGSLAHTYDGSVSPYYDMASGVMLGGTGEDFSIMWPY